MTSCFQEIAFACRCRKGREVTSFKQTFCFKLYVESLPIAHFFNQATFFKSYFDICVGINMIGSRIQ